MRLAILGGTGFIGLVLLRKAVAAGHQVRVLARTPGKLGPLASQVEVVQGDMFDPASLQALIRDVDAVISAAGPPIRGRHDSAPYEKATASLIDATKRAGVRRLITLAGAVARLPGESLGFRRTLMRWIFTPLIGGIIRTKDLEMALVAASGLDWTVVRPPATTKGKPTGTVKATDRALAGGKIDVEDLADFILSLLATDQWNGKAPTVASG